MMTIRPNRQGNRTQIAGLWRAWGRATDGGVAVTVAVMIAVLVGVLALSVDLSRLYNASTERFNAADAAALAAASQLDGSDGSCRRAIDAAVHADLVNRERFASNRTGPEVYISSVGATGDGNDPTSNPNIRFLSDLVKDNNGNVTGTYIVGEDDCDENAQYAEATLDQVVGGDDAQVDYYFAGVVGAVTEGFPRGYALAEHVKTTCGITPMMICELPVPDDLPAEADGLTFQQLVDGYWLTGRGLWLKGGEQTAQWGPGVFGFVELEGMHGVPDIGEGIGMVNSPWNCLAEGDDLDTKPGASEALRNYLNTRLDIYHGSVPDDDPQFQPSPNNKKGMYREGSGCGLGGGYVEPPVGPERYDGPNQVPPFAGNIMPFPKDECAYPGGSCIPDPGISAGRLGDGNWNYTEYMAVNHSGFALSAGATQSASTYEDIVWPSGIGADSKPSRYEIYLWEMGRLSSSSDFGCTSGDCWKDYDVKPDYVADTRLVPGSELPTGSDPQTGEYAYKQCFKGDLGDDNGSNTHLLKDRRVMEVLTVDCDNTELFPKGVKGNTEIPHEAILGTTEVFLVEPWKVNAGGGHEIYVEIIGPGGASLQNNVSKTVRDWVHLKESRQYQ